MWYLAFWHGGGVVLEGVEEGPLSLLGGAMGRPFLGGLGFEADVNNVAHFSVFFIGWRALFDLLYGRPVSIAARRYIPDAARRSPLRRSWAGV